MKEKVLKIWESIWAIELDDSLPRWLRSGKSLIRLFYTATERFYKDEDIIRAASISYAIVVSFIPTLIVGLLLAANFINIKDYEELAKEYVRKNSIPMDVQAYFKIIYELLNNTAALTGIGFLFVLFSTTSVLRNLEDAMNKIWHVNKKRPFIQGVAEFVMIVVFGPVLLAIGLTTGQSLLEEFAAPTLLRMEATDKDEYIVGEKKVLLKRMGDERWAYTNILDRIDYDFQKDTVVIDPEWNRVLGEAELQPIQHRVKRVSKQDLRTASFLDIAVQGSKIFILTDTDTLIYSRDGGDFWMARKFQKKQMNILVRAGFKRIQFLDETHAVIIGKSGLILRSSDAGETWVPHFSNAIKTDLNDLAVLKTGEILAVGEGLTAISSLDGGISWAPYLPISGLSHLEKENLNSIFVRGDSVYICGDAGAILKSKDSGSNWHKKNIGLKKIDFFGVYFLDENRGILVGDSGNISYTIDGGVVWKKAKSPTDQNLHHITYSEAESSLVILGENYHILKDAKGDMTEFAVLVKTPFWRIGVTALGQFILPFTVLWLIFFIVYQVLPYTDVHFKAAGIGALCTSAAMMAFIIGFQYYVAFFSAGKFAIYGTLAAIPLALLMVQVSTIIILYGCEVSYLVQHPDLVHMSYFSRNREEMEKQQIWKGLQILHRIYENFAAGNRDTTESELARYCRVEGIEMERLLSVFYKNQWVARVEEGGWVPLLQPNQLKLHTILDTLSPTGYEIQDSLGKNPLARIVKPMFLEYERARELAFQGKTLADLLPSPTEVSSDPTPKS